MKVKNLADYPQQLGDNRVIGAAGTKEDTREYDLEALAKEDKKRVKDETLTVIEEVEKKAVETETTSTPAQMLERETFLDSSEREKMPLVDAKNNNGGTKGKTNGGNKS